METPHIEIRDLHAIRVSGDGRVLRIRVVGRADRNDRRVDVETCVANLQRTEPSWKDQDVSAWARFVDPSRTSVRHRTPDRAFLWVAEIDVCSSLAVPPIFVGRQRVRINVRAHYAGDVSDVGVVIRSFGEILPTEEFDAGVLFVHGIGQHRRAETLAEWSSPLLLWINAWLAGGADEAARRLQGNPSLEGWLQSLQGCDDVSVDLDYVDRARFASDLVRKARAPSYATPKQEIAAIGQRALRSVTQPVTAADHADRDQVAQFVAEQLHASAVSGSAEFREANVLDVINRVGEPSTVEMHVKALAGDGYMLRTRWLLAESHWAESFWAPSFVRFARWCLLVAPVVLVHYIALARLRHTSFIRWYVTVLGLSTAVALSQIGFALLMLLWLLPWESVRAFALRIQFQLAGVVGDSYVLLEDPVQRRSIIDRVDRDLSWLLQQCNRVVVIAHSQGAAIAQQVLSKQERILERKIPSFVTLGTGITTLKAIEDLSPSRDVMATGWVALGCVAALGLAVAAGFRGAFREAGAIAVVALSALAIAALRAHNIHTGRPSVVPRAADFRTWLDVFGAKDPVPYGRALDLQEESKNYRPREVRNSNSVFADHTTYWQNVEQVVGPLVRQIGTAAEFQPVTNLLPDDAEVLARLERARFSRLALMRVGSTAIALITLMLLATAWPAWFAIGRWTVGWIESKVGLGGGAVSTPGFFVWMQALMALVPLLVYRTLAKSIFSSWTTTELERLLRRSAGSAATYWATIFASVVGLTIAVSIYFAWPVTPALFGTLTASLLTMAGWAASRFHSRRVGSFRAASSGKA